MLVLIADDDPSLRLALRMVLEAAAHEVLEAATVAEAREILAGQTVDVVLVDAGMESSGVDLWREIDTIPGLEKRALLLTGDVLALGALASHERTIGKPFDYGRLVARIEAIGARPSPN